MISTISTIFSICILSLQCSAAPIKMNLTDVPYVLANVNSTLPPPLNTTQGGSSNLTTYIIIGILFGPLLLCGLFLVMRQSNICYFGDCIVYLCPPWWTKCCSSKSESCCCDSGSKSYDSDSDYIPHHNYNINQASWEDRRIYSEVAHNITQAEINRAKLNSKDTVSKQPTGIGNCTISNQQHFQTHGITLD